MVVMPRIILMGTMFEIDYSNKLFLQSKNPANKIHFNEMVNYNGSLYALDYDLKGKTSIKDDLFDGEGVGLFIPKKVLDPKNNQNGIFPSWINKASYEKDWGILVVDDIIQHRLDGNLPQISIKETNYNIDILRGELTPINNEYSPLSIRKMGIDKDNFSFCFDPKSKKMLGMEVLFRAFEEGFLLADLPGLEAMDPVGFAKSLGLEETAFLLRTPINMQHHALTEPYTITKHKEQLNMLVTHSKRTRKEPGIRSRKKSNRIS